MILKDSVEAQKWVIAIIARMQLIGAPKVGALRRGRSSCQEAQRRGNLSMDAYVHTDCRATVIAMDGIYAVNAGAVYCRNHRVF